MTRKELREIRLKRMKLENEAISFPRKSKERLELIAKVDELTKIIQENS